MLFLAAEAIAQGDVKSLKDFLYWDNGNVRQCTVYDAQTGKLKAKAFCLYGGGIEKIEKFDPSGNKIEEALYDGKGRLKPGIDGWAAMRWRYSGSQVMLQITYDQFGNPIEQKFYSESGKLVMRLYKDDESVNPYVNAAMYMMLGGQNVRYYDPNASINEMNQMMNE